MLVPGDVVFVQPLDEWAVVVDRVEERQFVLTRQSANRTKTMAANIDTLVIVSALASPAMRTVLVDQLLVFCELHEVTPIMIFTKRDLADAADSQALIGLYASLGYRVLVINPKRGEGMEAMRASLHGRQAFLVGVSGVGKSSIFRSLGGESAVGDVSRFGLGKQTTTTARLARLGTGFLIDSPGVAEFGLENLGAAELTQGFVEMRNPSKSCRFRDCTHRTEPDCGVRAALAAGQIGQSRYESYCRILAGRSAFQRPRASPTVRTANPGNG